MGFCLPQANRLDPALPDTVSADGSVAAWKECEHGKGEAANSEMALGSDIRESSAPFRNPATGQSENIGGFCTDSVEDDVDMY